MSHISLRLGSISGALSFPEQRVVIELGIKEAA